MKTGILLSISLASLAGLAQAQCLDTLYLKELTVYSMSLVNSKTKVAWTETKLDPWNEQDLRKASSPISDVYKNTFLFTMEMVHPRVVYAICDQSKWSAVANVVVTDSSWQEPEPSLAKKYERFVRQDSVPVKSLSKIGLTTFTFQGGGEPFDGGWVSGDSTFSIGVKSDTITLQASASAVVLKAGFARWTDIPLSYTYLYPARGASEAVIDAGLAKIGPFVDSIGLKSYDSTRFDGVIYKYSFS
ncbi:MAG TPA: hypothetical protein PKY05_05555, partial [Fibrobacteria bacterium]|nr:hypothetical protein [Fibrobacteria bacterium]